MAEIQDIDVAIIGAGMAGISAARTLHAHNRKHVNSRRSFVVLEADNKIGGRVQSELIHRDRDKSIIINPGAQWFHKDMKMVPDPISRKLKPAPENPLLANAERKFPLIEDPMPRVFYNNGIEDHSKNRQLIEHARSLIDAYDGEDMSLAEFFNRQGIGTPPALRTTFGEVETGAPLEETSLLDVRNNVACNMGHFTEYGMGRFVRNYAKDIENRIQLNTKIKRIVWDPSGVDPTTVECTNGSVYRAKEIILTASVGVLKSGQIEFVPPIPKSHQEQLDNIYMGNFNKAFLVFNEHFKIPVAQNTHVDLHTKDVSRKMVYAGDERAIQPQDMFYLANDNGGHGKLVTAFFGGELARMCDESPKDATHLAVRGLEEIWGGSVRRHLEHTQVTQWGKNPLVRGGYSRVAIGHHEARLKLAEPFGRIHLAGEAYGTIHPETGRNWATHMAGAAISGERAAKNVLELLHQQSVNSNWAGRSQQNTGWQLQ